MNNKISINLFKCVSGNEFSGISEKALRYGILMPNGPKNIIDHAIEKFGKDGVLFNSTFHKSFNTVKDADILTLLVQQVLHYFTTYGTDFQSDYVYFPTETLNIPTLKKEEIKLVNIKKVSLQDIHDKIIKLCSIALSRETIHDVCELIQSMEDDFPEIFEEMISKAKNKEVKCIMCQILGTVPSDPNEFLRYCIYLATGNTLKIKDKLTLRTISWSKNNMNAKISINNAFKMYITKYGINRLANIYKANKKFFLTLKNSGNAFIINRISRKGKKVKPVFGEIRALDVLTNTDVPWDEGDKHDLMNELSAIPVFKELALLNTLKYRVQNPKYIEYKIRNGKSFLTEMKPPNIEELSVRLGWLKEHLVSRVSPMISGKTFYIPENISYALPTSEKDFVGNIPNGSSIKISTEEAFVAAICWKTECDLDLSLIDENGCKIGWNANYRDSNLKTLFSGDMTHLDESGNASEAIYLEGGEYTSSLRVNLFFDNSGKKEIPFKFVLAKSPVLDNLPYGTEYVIDPNSVLETIDMNIESSAKELMLGTLTKKNNSIVFVFGKTKSGNSTVSCRTNIDEMRDEVTKIRENCRISLKKFLKTCGGTVISKLPKNSKDIVDLSLENLSKESLLNLFAK